MTGNITCRDAVDFSDEDSFSPTATTPSKPELVEIVTPLAVEVAIRVKARVPMTLSCNRCKTIDILSSCRTNARCAMFRRLCRERLNGGVQREAHIHKAKSLCLRGGDDLLVPDVAEHASTLDPSTDAPLDYGVHSNFPDVRRRESCDRKPKEAGVPISQLATVAIARVRFILDGHHDLYVLGPHKRVDRASENAFVRDIRRSRQEQTAACPRKQ